MLAFPEPHGEARPHYAPACRVAALPPSVPLRVAGVLRISASLDVDTVLNEIAETLVR